MQLLQHNFLVRMKRISEINHAADAYQYRLIAWQIIFSSFEAIITTWQMEHANCQLITDILQKYRENPYYFLTKTNHSETWQETNC